MNDLLQDFEKWDVVGKSDPLPPVTELAHVPGAPDPFAALRAACPESPVWPGTKVTVVGGVSKQGRLHPHDQGYLEHAFALCMSQNLGWSKDFRVTAINNADDNANGDFLKTQPATNVLIIACVANVSASHDDSRCRGVARSELHHRIGSWYTAAKNSGADVIFAFGGLNEVAARHFSPDRHWNQPPPGIGPSSPWQQILRMTEGDRPGVYQNWIACMHEGARPVPMTSLIRKDMAARPAL